MVAIGNPIRGVLHDNNWVRPPGNTDMRVTKTAAQHVASGGPPGLDIGDGAPDLDDILSPHDGTVAQAFTFGSANLSIDFDSEGRKWRIVLAHNTLPHPVAVGQAVTEGQVVGRMGSTSSPTKPVPIHLHIQLGWLNGSTWVWEDPWIHLNQEADMKPIPPAKFRPIVNKQTAIALPGGATLRADRFNNATALKLYPVGTAFTPLAQAEDGDLSGGSTTWYGGLSGTDAGVVFGWIQASALGPFVDTAPDCAAEVLKAVAPLEKRLRDINVISAG